MISCAFMGHRPKHFLFQYDESDDLCIRIKKAIFEECKRLCREKGVTDFYTGCALGVDTWSAEAVLKLKTNNQTDIKLICAKPFEGFERAWTNPQITRLNNIIAAADRIITVSDTAEDAYRRRNYYLVDNSEYLIVVYDNAKEIRSGTYQTVSYAKRSSRKITLINPATAEVEYL